MSGKVLEFLEQLKIGLYQKDCFWSKFELNGFWNIWTVEPNVFGEMGYRYCLVVGVILVGAEELEII